jgi:hypothetical protein
MHRVEVSAPDIAGADKSNLPTPESFRSRWPILNLRVASSQLAANRHHAGLPHLGTPE